MTCHQCGAEEENPESGLCKMCEAEAQKKINGLLYLPALGLISSLLYGALNLFYISRVLLTIYHLTDQIMPYALFMPVALMIDFLITIYASYCFFRKLSKTKYVMAVYYAVGALYAFYLAGVPLLLYDTRPSGTEIRICGSALAGLLIWIPYFLRAKKVDQVFTH